MFLVTAIPAFNDNYIWLFQKPDSQDVFVVDPGDANPVIRYLDQANLNLVGILITHHHADHTGGVKQLTELYDPIIYGPSNSPYKGITHKLTDGDHCSVLGETFQIKHVPAHTLDHISYFFDGEQPILFCGDTLFLAGCGRIFEGTPTQMYSAMQYFNTLPAETLVYCTHEYSLANLAFAEAVEPENKAIQHVIGECREKRSQDLPTLPSSIKQERLINPFMRTAQESVQHAASQYSSQTLKDEASVLAVIRAWKNSF